MLGRVGAGVAGRPTRDEMEDGSQAASGSSRHREASRPRSISSIGASGTESEWDGPTMPPSSSSSSSS
eukprot:ctg_3241.g474